MYMYSNNQTETLVHNNLLLDGPCLACYLPRKRCDWDIPFPLLTPFCGRYDFDLPKIEVTALENGVVPSFVLFKWLNCIARPNK